MGDSNIRIIVERNLSESRKNELDINSWRSWKCGMHEFTMNYHEDKMCYFVKGKGKVKGLLIVKDNATKKENETKKKEKEKKKEEKVKEVCVVEFGEGDLVTFPKGLSYTWNLSAPMDVRYKTESSSSSSSSSSSPPSLFFISTSF